MAKGMLSNPVVQIVLACVIILVIATLTFASAISGALTAEKSRFVLVSQNCSNYSGITRSSRISLGSEEDRRLITLIFYYCKPSIV